MNIDELVSEITNRIENFKNYENITWHEVINREFNRIKDINDDNKSLILVRVVKEISRRGYLINDFPFKLTK